MISCDICAILATHNDGKDVQVFETQHWRGVLDNDQRSLGKMFITLREHIESLAELSPQQASEFFEIVTSIERAITGVYKPTHFNWQCLMNMAVEAGKATHVHWHLHPRYEGVRIVGGHTFSDGVKARAQNIVNQSLLETIRDDIVRGMS